jgi:hypothetical protein
MKTEHQVRMIVLDANFPGEVAKLRDEGWQTDPQIPPVTVYHLFRRTLGEGEKAPDGGLGFDTFGIKAELRVDDSKVLIGKADGRILHADGTKYVPTENDKPRDDTHGAELQPRNR